METAKIGTDILLNASWSEKGYGESMPVPQDDEDMEPPTDAAAATGSSMVLGRAGAGVDLRESATGWQVISGQLEVRRRTRYSVPVHAWGSVPLFC